MVPAALDGSRRSSRASLAGFASGQRGVGIFVRVAADLPRVRKRSTLRKCPRRQLTVLPQSVPSCPSSRRTRRAQHAEQTVPRPVRDGPRLCGVARQLRLGRQGRAGLRSSTMALAAIESESTTATRRRTVAADEYLARVSKGAVASGLSRL